MENLNTNWLTVNYRLKQKFDFANIFKCQFIKYAVIEKK